MPQSTTLSCSIIDSGKSSARRIAVENAVIAGWTGRDPAAMEMHIAELEALGVARPASTPLFYRVASTRLTTAEAIEVSGTESSGEVEFVLVQSDGGLFVGVGSDHTDRKVEAYNITVSKQMCDKPLAPVLWSYASLHDHWDDLILRAYAIDGTGRTLYQEGTVGAMLAPDDLISRYTGGAARLAEGTLMFCGTLAAIGGVRPAERFEFELEDPVLDRRISHGYRVQPLPIVG